MARPKMAFGATDSSRPQHRGDTPGAKARLLELLGSGEPCVRVVGPRGVGKSELLAAVQRSLPSRWTSVLIGDPASSSQAIWQAIAGQLGSREQAERAVARASARALAKNGALLLIVDDAHLLQERTRRHLAQACVDQAGLRVVLAETDPTSRDSEDEDRPGEVLLPEVLAASEARAYVREWASWKWGPEAPGQLDDEILDQLHQEADGNVASLLALVDDLPGIPASESIEGAGTAQTWWKAGQLSLVIGRIARGARAGATALAVQWRRGHPLDVWRRIQRERTPEAIQGAAAILALLLIGLAAWQLLGTGGSVAAPAAPPSVGALAAPIVEALAQPIPQRTALVNLNAEPWAEIEIDGVPAGKTPLGEVSLPSGARRIVARFPDGRLVTRTIELGEDEIFLLLRADDPQPTP